MSKKALETAKEILKHMQSNPADVQTLEKAMQKDDKPHAPNTPEDKAHDVVEEGQRLPAAIAQNKGSTSRLLAHLRSLSDPSKQRSPQNQAAGVAKAGVGGMSMPKPTAPKPIGMPAPA